MALTLKINGRERRVEAEPDTPLLWVLRDELDLKGTKFGCGAAFCGACTVHINGTPARSCQIPVSLVSAGEVTTIEGMESDEVGRRVQAAWRKVDVMQCGYCQAGQILAATALLTRTPKPTDEQIDQAMNGNLCRCGTYHRIRTAIKEAAGMSAGDKTGTPS